MDGGISQPVTKRARTSSSISKLLQYPFLKHLLLPLLDDYDVLICLAITGKSVTSWLNPYTVRSFVGWERAIKLLTSELHVPLIIQRVGNVESLDFAALPNPHAIAFSFEFNELIPPGSIPASVQEIRFGNQFNQRLEQGSIPSSVKIIQFCAQFNQSLLPGVIPEGVKEVHFAMFSNLQYELIPGSLPSTLTSLTLYDYCAPLPPEVLPSSLIKFKSGMTLDYPLEIGSLPKGVKDICFGCEFNQSLSPGIIPDTVTSLCLSDAFDQHLLPGDLPDSLKILALPEESVIHPIPGCLPNSITELELGGIADYHVLPNGLLPQSLTKLVLHVNRQSFEHGFLPENLTHLNLTGVLNCRIVPGMFPNSLTHLALNNEFENFSEPLQMNSLPPNLVHVELRSSFDQIILPGLIPPNVVKLCFSQKLSRTLAPGSVPDSVRFIELYRPRLLTFLPSTATHLTLHIDEDSLVPGMIPSQVTYLDLYLDNSRGWFDSLKSVSREPQYLAQRIPNSVKYLTLLNASWLDDTSGVEANVSTYVSQLGDERLPNWYDVNNTATQTFDDGCSRWESWD